MRKLMVFVIVVQSLGFAANAQRQSYKFCVSSRVVEQITKTPCNYQAAQSAASIAQGACMNTVLDEVLADKSIKPASEEFVSAIKNKQVSAASDAREMIINEGKRCGDDVTINGDGTGSSIHTTHGSVR